MLIGDFNSNTIWDRKRRAGNHSNVVKFLEEKGIYSTYHLHHKQVQGKERHPTLYLYRHLDKPYHLDYCFVSADMACNLKSVKIGDHDFWTKYSDHVPVIVTFKNDSSINSRGKVSRKENKEQRRKINLFCFASYFFFAPLREYLFTNLSVVFIACNNCKSIPMGCEIYKSIQH